MVYIVHLGFYSRNFSGKTMKITFTSLHGVGHSYMVKAFQKLQYENYIPVKEQMYPDPDFPTVVFPNPEEKNCLVSVFYFIYFLYC